MFSVFRRSSECPLYRIEKSPKLARKQGAYSIVAATGLILKRGNELRRVLACWKRACGWLRLPRTLADCRALPRHGREGGHPRHAARFDGADTAARIVSLIVSGRSFAGVTVW